MILFNELRIAPDKKHLVIDVQVLDLPYYENVLIDSIVLDTQKTFVETGPSSNPLMTISCGGVKHFRDFIDIDTLADNLFFVYAVSTGDPAEDTPCGMKDLFILGVVYDKYPQYVKGMKLFGEMNGCDPPNNFINYILQLKAFDISLNTGNYIKAIEYWNNFFDYKERTISTKCGCHGRTF